MRISGCLASYFHLQNMNDFEGGKWRLDKPRRVKYMRTMDENVYLVLCETFDDPEEKLISERLGKDNGFFLIAIMFDGEDYFIQQASPGKEHWLESRELYFFNGYGLRNYTINCPSSIIKDFLNADGNSFSVAKTGPLSFVSRQIKLMTMPPAAELKKGGLGRGMKKLPKDFLREFEKAAACFKLDNGTIIVSPSPECTVDCEGILFTCQPFQSPPLFRYVNNSSWQNERSEICFPIENKLWRFDSLIVNRQCDYFLKALFPQLFNCNAPEKDFKYMLPYYFLFMRLYESSAIINFERKGARYEFKRLK